jgi:hypothetical protein
LKNILSKLFQAKANISRDKSHEVENFSHEEVLNTRGRGRGQANRGGRGRGRVFNANNKGRDNDTNDGGKKFGKSQVQCFYCKIFGHYESNCWKKQKQQANFSEEKGDVGTFFWLVIQLTRFPRRYGFWIVAATTT